MSWRPIRQAPKDGTRILIAHQEMDGVLVHIGWWCNQCVPDWLYRNAIQPKGVGAHTLLPSRNPHCQGRWVAEAAEELGHGGYLYEDLKVLTAYTWDPLSDIVGWKPLPRPPRRVISRRKSGRNRP